MSAKRNNRSMFDGPNIPEGARRTTCVDCGWTYGTHSPTCSVQDEMHTESSDCWCCPTLDFMSEDGTAVYIHHKAS
jgi:hypothetical protein